MKTPHHKTSKRRQTWTKQKSSSQVTGNLFKGGLIALFIAITPYIFYSYKIFPDTKVWENFLFTYQANWYQEVSTSIWTLMGKLVPLMLLTVWFFTCKHWWYHVILIPIGMFAFQLISIINDDARYFDVVEIWYLIPIMAIIVPLVYLIRAKIFANIHDPDLNKFEEELGVRQGLWTQIKDLFH